MSQVSALSRNGACVHACPPATRSHLGHILKRQVRPGQVRSVDCSFRRRVFAPQGPCATRAHTSSHIVVAANSQVSDLHTKWGKRVLIDHNPHTIGDTTAPWLQLDCLGSKQLRVLVRAGIDGHVEFDEGKGGQTIARLKHACGSTAEVYLYGANVVSWKQPEGEEILYTRPDAVFDKSKPISGGIPHCFPVFGPAPAPMTQHGFARQSEWTVANTSADQQPDDRDPEIELVLEDNEYTRSMWPHKFKAVYAVTLHGELLRTDLRIINTGKEAFEFTAALHTYIEVLDIKKASVKGLKDLEFLNKVKDPNNPTKQKEDRELIKFTGPADSVYLKARDYVELDVGTGAAVSISSSGWEDVVVWNPWEAMRDCYQRFACVENAKFNSPAVVQPGESWRAQQEFAVIDL